LRHLPTRIDAFFLSPLHLDRLILGWEYFAHYNRWFRRELAAMLRDIIHDPKTLMRPYWNAHYLTKMVDDHVRGRKNNLGQIRKVLTVELIHRELLERTTPLPTG
jgi:hypothetical protein